MARKLRVEYAGAIYHVMNRGDRREAIFDDDQDRERFLGTLGEACVKTGWQVHAFCLLPNHFHLVVETPQGNLVAEKGSVNSIIVFCVDGIMRGRQNVGHGTEAASGICRGDLPCDEPW